MVVWDLQNSVVLMFDFSSSLAVDTRSAAPRAKSIIHNSSFNSILLSGFPTKYHDRNAREKAANETPYYGEGENKSYANSYIESDVFIC